MDCKYIFVLMLQNIETDEVFQGTEEQRSTQTIFDVVHTIQIQELFLAFDLSHITV